MSQANVIARRAIRLCLRGQVQGRGVRPAIARLADQHRLAGSVQNTLGGLEIVVEGDPAGLARFRGTLASTLPAGCRLDSVDEEGIDTEDRCGFAILREECDGPLTTHVPPDIAACPECLREVGDRAARRYQYALTTCAACGPRYTIIDQMPYERPQTTLADFPLCCDCQHEYACPTDRRFHAQTIGCQKCGPQIWATDDRNQCVGRNQSALIAAIAALQDGRILALRGVGGYQLLCDAENDEAVRRLRLRKHRPAKPLALLVCSPEAARRVAFLSETEHSALTDSSNPIVLLRARGDTSLATSIHPGLDTVGVMLPTTPLHALLAEAVGRPLVCTSANQEGEPLEYEPDAAQRRLAGIADMWLHHDRPISRPIDDSVVRVIAESVVTFRLARGLAPLPLDCTLARPTLALGGHLKASLAWNNGCQSVLGPHVGDLDGLTARERFVAIHADSQGLYRFAPTTTVHDLHPDYFTTRYAEQQPTLRLPVQHHFAHVAAGMLEHGLLDRRVLGIAWDGTGYGTDGTIWGGEFLMVEGARRFDRVAHLRPFPLPGGESAVHEPVRTAVAILADAVGGEQLLHEGINRLNRTQIAQLLKLCASPRLSVWTTSAGRLFDAAAALILGIDRVDFEGQAAMMLESSVDRSAIGSYSLPLVAEHPAELDWRPLFSRLWSDRRAGVAPGVMAMRFHRALAEGLTAVIRRHPGVPVVLCGGVFQNRLLTELVVELSNDSRRLMLPGRIPPNDGGLAAGQLAIASRLSMVRE